VPFPWPWYQNRLSRAATVERSARQQRNRGDRTALIAQLNDPRSNLGEMVDYLAGKTGSRETITTGRIPRIVIYLRVSTEEQATMGGEAEGYSISVSA